MTIGDLGFRALEHLAIDQSNKIFDKSKHPLVVTNIDLLNFHKEASETVATRYEPLKPLALLKDTCQVAQALVLALLINLNEKLNLKSNLAKLTTSAQ